MSATGLLIAIVVGLTVYNSRRRDQEFLSARRVMEVVPWLYRVAVRLPYQPLILSTFPQKPDM
jgi:hypothetical protein